MATFRCFGTVIRGVWIDVEAPDEEAALKKAEVAVPSDWNFWSGDDALHPKYGGEVLVEETDIERRDAPFYCGHCGEEIGEKYEEITELKLGVASANAGEFAILCYGCALRYYGALAVGATTMDEA